MPFISSQGFLSAKITATGISIYKSLVALDPATSWPETVNRLLLFVAGTVNLDDGTHTGTDPLPAGWQPPFESGSASVKAVYLDNMIVRGGGTLTCYLSC